MRIRFRLPILPGSFFFVAVLLVSIVATAEEKEDPYRAYPFRVLIGEKEVAYFTECSGLGVKVQPIEYREAGTEGVRKLPGPVEYGDLTLRYGVATDMMLWNWLIETAKGNLVRKSLSIQMLDNDGKTVVFQWHLAGAWPSGWEGNPADKVKSPVSEGFPKSQAIQDAAVVFESLTITFESLEREGGAKEDPKKKVPKED